jgi:hypothetical protein
MALAVVSEYRRKFESRMADETTCRLQRLQAFAQGIPASVFMSSQQPSFRSQFCHASIGGSE